MKKRTFVAVLIVGAVVFNALIKTASPDPLASLSPAQRDSARRADASVETLRRRASETAFNGKLAIKSRLRDPESAQFGRVWAGGDSQVVACGYVNAKNGFGGYTGEELYWGVPPIVVTAGELQKLSQKERKALASLAVVCDTTMSFSRR